LEKVSAIKEGTRQIVDILPIKAVFTQYHTCSKRILSGYCSASNFPKGVDFHVNYGVNTEALSGYFHARQYLPFARM